MTAATLSQEINQAAAGFGGSIAGIAALLVFGVAILLVVVEEFARIRKSTPVILAAGIIWILFSVAAAGRSDIVPADLLGHNLLEYAELLLFLLVAMTYVHTLEERQVFDVLRHWLVARQLGMRALFWVTGALAFCLSPLLDNLTTALVLGAVVVAVGKGNRRFVPLACINVVVAANAGGAFSPFGDITTLMVWQEGLVTFTGFLKLFVPSLVNWLVPAAIMSIAVPDSRMQAGVSNVARLRVGGVAIIVLFAATIALTVALHQLYHLPPVVGMMTGLGALRVCGYYIRAEQRRLALAANTPSAEAEFDIYRVMRYIEWDTLLFFYGVIICIGGLAAFGYLVALSQSTYATLGPTATNILVGIASALVDNIPVMFSVLSIGPAMSHGQWLLVTLTAGVGGSMLSIGSAAGVALMGQARGVYTFFAHLKWTWAIALGYAASIATHFWINARHF